MKNFVLCAVALLGLTATLALARADESPVLVLEAGDPVYQDIVAALTPAVEADVGAALRLEVNQIKTQDDFAFVAAEVVNPDGSALDFSATSYADAVSSGLFDGPNLWAYLRLANGTWTVLEQDIGPTDAWFAYWPEAHGGSCVLTGLSQGC